MIGLKRGTVKLVQHQASWTERYEREKLAIRELLGNSVKDIQHIGSTAIPGIMAKPIIDILLGVKSLRWAKSRMNKLTILGYTFRPQPEKNRRQLLYVKGPESKRVIYLHIVRYGGSVWKKDIYFRDQLRKNATLARRYEKLKRALAKQFPNERAKYTALKLPFIFNVQSGYKKKL